VFDSGEIGTVWQFPAALRDLVTNLARYQWAAQLHDKDWQLVWASSELDDLAPELRTGRMRPGQHIIEGFVAALGLFTEDSRERWVRANIPFVLGTDPDAAEAITEMLGPELGPLVDTLKPTPPPQRWFSCIDLAHGEFAGRIHYIVETILDGSGEVVGYLMLYAPDLPPKLLNLLTRGDRRMHERMAELVEPAPRSAALLFADIEGSGVLSRHISSAAYFRLIRALRAGFDAAVGQFGGVLGKHAGDGVTALFLTEQLGSDSGAARAAIEGARALRAVAVEVVAALAEDGLPVNSDLCRLNVGVHWGGTLFVGQVSSEGRLEITALGDEMNEAARIEQTARGGRTLASKSLVERLTRTDAVALGLDIQAVGYQILADIAGVSSKASRDAGFIAVTQLD
jgi:class 3 adenylate cyclase